MAAPGMVIHAVEMMHRKCPARQFVMPAGGAFNRDERRYVGFAATADSAPLEGRVACGARFH